MKVNPDEKQLLVKPVLQISNLRRTMKKEESYKVRAKIRGIVEGKIVTVILSLVTVFALFGDDVRLWVTTKNADPYFYCGLIVSFILFTTEILLNSIVIDDFKYSFFFWLDLIATLSLIPDIRWIIDLIGILINTKPSYESANVLPGQMIVDSMATSKIQKVVKSLRLIRLIRIIKLYKYIVQSKKDDDPQQVQGKRSRRSMESFQDSQTDESEYQSNFMQETDPSKLGKALSDTITRRVIIGVLLMLMVLPLLSYSEIDISAEYGLRELFWFGRSNCKKSNGDFYCDEKPWVSQNGWYEMLRSYANSSQINENDKMSKQLLWVYLPDYDLDGRMNSIQKIPNEIDFVSQGSVSDENFWIQDDRCAGFAVQDDCPWRYEEMTIISFSPIQCTDGEISGCDELIAYARFNKRQEKKDEAVLQFATTIFTCFVLTIASLTFNNDTQQIVIKPILKIVKIIQTLAEKPLKKPIPPILDDEDNQDDDLNENPQENMEEDDDQGPGMSPPELDLTNDNQLNLNNPNSANNQIVQSQMRFGGICNKLKIWKSKQRSSITSNKALAKNSSKSSSQHMKTKMLEITIFKISTLLQRGFGEFGAPIVSNIVNTTGEQYMDLYVQGKRQNKIFSYCHVRQFTETTESLQDEIIVFVNKIVKIVHECAEKWEGEHTKNYGDKYLLTWNLPTLGQEGKGIQSRRQQKNNNPKSQPQILVLEASNKGINNSVMDKSNVSPNDISSQNLIVKNPFNKNDDNQDESMNQFKEEDIKKIRQITADKSLIAAVKIIVELRRAQDLQAYSRHPKIAPKFGQNYRTKVTFGLHTGWAIEGAIGSEYKVDALHISPDCQIAKRIDDLCEYYDSTVLISQDLCEMLSDKARSMLRMIDRVQMDETKGKSKVSKRFIINNIQELYTFDMRFQDDHEQVDFPTSDSYEVGGLIKHSNYTDKFDMFNNAGNNNMNVDYMFTMDHDFVTFAKKNEQFESNFKNAYQTYIMGDWQSSQQYLTMCLEIHNDDGPSLAMSEYMEKHKNECPDEWIGVRDIDEKPPAPNMSFVRPGFDDEIMDDDNDMIDENESVS